MNKTQKLGFRLSGLTFLVCGVVMAALGFAYGSVPLQFLGPIFAINGVFWIATPSMNRCRYGRP